MNTRAMNRTVDLKMACPRDDHPLVLHEHGQARLHACDSCHGVWIDREHLERWFKSGAMAARTAARRTQPKLTAPRRTGICCPSCGTVRLQARKFSDVEVDMCPACRGIWLDAGELEAIVERYHARRKSGVTRGERFSTLADGVGEVVSNPAVVTDAAGLLGDVFDGAPELAADAGAAILEFLGEVIAGIF